MNGPGKTARSSASLRRVWVVLGIMLVGTVCLSSRTEEPKEAREPSPLANVQVIFQGPEQVVVGQRFTVEVILLNQGAAPVKDLEFLAKMDAHLEQETKGQEHRVAVEPISADDLRIVRLTLTAKKNAPGGIDITLKAKGGASEQVRHVLPVVPEYLADKPAKTENGSHLQCKITALRDCFADRTGIFLLQVRNTDSKAMESKLEATVSYATPGRVNAAVPNPSVPGGGPQAEQLQFGGDFKRGGRGPVPVMSTPIRSLQISVPTLGAGESCSVPFRLIPQRIGELQIAITNASTIKGEGGQMLASARLPVKFDPKAPITDLVPDRETAAALARLPKTLTEVPEVSLEDPLAKAPPPDQGFEHIAHLIEKINHANMTRTDAFVEALLARRPDMNGLPFTMGNACRLPTERGRLFFGELNTLRAAMGNPAAMASGLPNPANQNGEESLRARIAAMVQVIGPESVQLKQEMVKYLSTASHGESTQVLAKLAIFSEEEQVRKDALKALSARREKDYDAILLGGLNYPWPAVAERAGEAIASLKRKDLIPQLIEMFDRSDPRAPQTKEKDGKKVIEVRELVRVNHFRNCLLCHSPANPAEVNAQAGGAGGGVPDVDEGRQVRRGGGMVMNGLVAPVPIPGQQVPTPSPSGGYGRFSIPETLVKFDVTYLRQDFSVKLPVTNAQPWPELQRFDFLVRTRQVTEKEAEAYGELVRAQKFGDLTPYQRAAQTSLRLLTGKDAEPMAAAWRQVVLGEKKAEK